MSSYQKDGVFRRLRASSSSSIRTRFAASAFAKDSFSLEISSLFADVDDPVVATTTFRSSLGRYGHAIRRIAMAKAAIKVLKKARESTLRVGIAPSGPTSCSRRRRRSEAGSRGWRVNSKNRPPLSYPTGRKHILLTLRSKACVFSSRAEALTRGTDEQCGNPRLHGDLRSAC